MSEILERIAKREARACDELGLPSDPSADCESQRAVRTAVHRLTMLVARDAWKYGYGRPFLIEETYDSAAQDIFPLPPKPVLREEHVPGEPDGPLFRVLNGRLEWTPIRDGEVNGRKWHAYEAWYEGGIAVWRVWARVRHALDLHDNPFREVPDDGGDDA